MADSNFLCLLLRDIDPASVILLNTTLRLHSTVLRCKRVNNRPITTDETVHCGKT